VAIQSQAKLWQPSREKKETGTINIQKHNVSSWRTNTKPNFINMSIVKMGKLHCGSTLQTAACYAMDLDTESYKSVIRIVPISLSCYTTE
jgi:hypothetical protein